MKRLTGTQKLSAVLGAGLLIAAASGSVFAMHKAEERDIRQIEIRQGKESAPLASPLPTPTSEPTSEPHDEVEFTGAVEVMAGDMWVVGGRTVMITAATEIKPGLDIGTLAKVQAVRQADGTLLASEIEPAAGNDNANVSSNEDHGNSNDDHNGNVNSNDDHDNSNENGNVNSNEDHSNSNDHHDGNVSPKEDHANSNNHHGNSNEHNGNSNVNSNDDHASNSNDDHGGNDQHSGHGNDS